MLRGGEQLVHHITIVGADRRTSIDFWEGLLGMPFVFEQPALSTFRMASPLNPSHRPMLAPSAGGPPRLSDAAIDASTRVPVVVFVASAVAWLLFGTLLAVISSIKLHVPAFLGDLEFLT